MVIPDRAQTPNLSASKWRPTTPPRLLLEFEIQLKFKFLSCLRSHGPCAVKAEPLTLKCEYCLTCCHKIDTSCLNCKRCVGIYVVAIKILLELRYCCLAVWSAISLWLILSQEIGVNNIKAISNARCLLYVSIRQGNDCHFLRQSLDIF
jgi:hypothetical protein